ncbi:MAG: DUF368 domain-containing protein [Anaerolineaceae bacterium]|nr:DUF368 domain-containing protein [Anaerolineaceae bacterium]
MQADRTPLLHPRGWLQYLRLYGSGIAMGAADLVPGVSGGTMALILGIYRALLEAIRSVNGHHLRMLLAGRFLQLWREFPWRFLLALGIGLLSAVFLLANVLGELLEKRPTFLYAFFAGMIIASILAIVARVRWGGPQALAFLLSTVAAFVIVAAPQLQEADHSLPTLFFSGMLAICAMILPGISGSFILLILGQYEYVLGLVRQLELIPLAVFAFGCVLGLMLFSRLLSWLLRHYEHTTMALLAGFMLGSLRLIVREASEGVAVLPHFAWPEQALVLALTLAGLLLVSVLDQLAAGENPLMQRVGWFRGPRKPKTKR